MHTCPAPTSITASALTVVAMELTTAERTSTCSPHKQSNLRHDRNIIVHGKKS